MEEKTITNKKVNLLALLSVCLFIVSGFISLNSWLFIMVPIVTAFFIYDINHKYVYTRSTKLIIFDYLIYIMCFVEIICCIRSIYKPNSIDATLKILMITVFYSFVRTFIIFRSQMLFLNRLLTITAGFLSLITLLLFLVHREKFLNVDFTDLTNFKQYYRPFGRLSNDWATIMLCLLPFSITSIFYSSSNIKWLYFLITILNVVAISVSLSRGAVMATLLFFAISFIFVYFFKSSIIKQTIFVYITIFLGTIFLTYQIKDSLLTTFAFSKTVSQIRSIDGRYNKWRESVIIFKLFPTSGVGPGNYSLASENYIRDKKGVFTSRSTNTYFQLLAEKGIIGFIIYFILFITSIYVPLKRLKKNKLYDIIFFSGILALYIKEATFSTLFENDMVIVLFVLMILFYIYPKQEQEYEIFENKK